MSVGTIQDFLMPNKRAGFVHDANEYMPLGYWSVIVKMSEKKCLGQRLWFSDGTISEDWEESPEDGLLIRMLYYADGTKQIQQGMDFYYEAPHHSGETIRGAGMDKDEIAERYPGAVIKRGVWSPDEYYQQIVDEAMNSAW